jgi:indolepyruvate ferredoxin oxidoreductase alpha subunit
VKHLADLLLSREPRSEIVIGNTALVRAFVEAGTRVVTSYPGSPTPEIADAIAAIPADRRPFRFEFSVNEKVATEVAFGAAMNGHLATVFFKSVGLNVAADTFVQLSLQDIPGGMVVVLGDDPGANSSQNEQDNRHLCRMAYLPVWEPADPAEAYAMYREAAAEARARRMAAVLRLTTHVCHQKRRVAFGPWDEPPLDATPRFDAATLHVPLAATVAPMKRRALERLASLAEHAERTGANRLDDNGNRRRGILTAGLPYLSALDALADAAGAPDILKLAMVNPLPRGLVARFLRDHDEVKVLEELDEVIETSVKAIAFDERIPVRIIGKRDDEERIGEHTPSKVRAVLAAAWPDLLPPPAPRAAVPAAAPPVPERPPQLCPGCGHRSAFHAIRDALAPEDITVADIGCHTLGYLPPHGMGRLLMCMGSSPGMAAGLRLFTTARKVVGFLGDSTLFHAGLPGIVNAVFNRHPVTLVLMENGTTAMTGHQELPSSGRNFNEPSEAVPVRRVLEGLGVKHVAEVDAYKQAELAALVREAVARDEFSVVIARHPCMLKLTRERRRKGASPDRRVEVAQDRCRRVHDCIGRFGCPTFTRGPDGSVRTNPDLCIGDGSCRQVCPEEALDSVAREEAP